MNKLAIFGGRPVLRQPLPVYNSIGKEELNAVIRVMESGCLSGFYGSWGDRFLGGPMVREFESRWSDAFNVKYAISVNSATSGLFAAMGAIGIGPGDEVILPPYTMSATAMAPLVYGGTPVFADIEPDTYCLDPAAVRRAITPRTKGILAVNLFGHPARLLELREIAEGKGIQLVEDSAQSPLASENGRYAGTIGHIGVFSLNYHKHIHTGEGGVCVTDDPEFAKRLQMIRNHAENVTEDMGVEDIRNMIGFNYRLTELSAAVGIEQLKKIERHIGRREKSARILTEGVRDLPGLVPPLERSGCRHVYYLWALRIEEKKAGISREAFSRALAAEGFPHFSGYVRPLYLLPVFQRRVAFGAHPLQNSGVSYAKGLCPVAERMHEKELICFENCMYDLNEDTLKLMVEAVRKVYAHRDELTCL